MQLINYLSEFLCISLIAVVFNFYIFQFMVVVSAVGKRLRLSLLLKSNTKIETKVAFRTTKRVKRHTLGGESTKSGGEPTFCDPKSSKS